MTMNDSNEEITGTLASSHTTSMTSTNHPSHAHSHGTTATTDSVPMGTRVAHGATVTLTETQNDVTQEVEVLRLTLAARPSVRWDENVLDNEGLGRKSSKRCCIFHKQRSFGESSTDSSDYDSDRSGSSAASGSGGDDKNKKPRKKGHRIARPKKSGHAPDYQRFHA
jgi:protein phosphatase 1 regulatory subunit 11